MAAQTVKPTLNVKDIDPERITAEIVKAEGSIIKAAKALNVRTGELRRFCLKDRALIEAALEAAELALDKAEAQVWRALRKGQLSNRLQAAAFVVRSRGRGRS
jgi:hypothetical protein